jgi:RNA polymerase sigma-70 factor, ECF subfamily
MQTTSSVNSIHTQEATSIKQAKSDQSLLASIADGKAFALETLLARHQAAVYRFALRLTKSESLAEETVSEVFLEVWRGAGKFEGKSQVLTWLLAIARNKAIQALRHRKEAQLDDAEALTIEDSSDDPEEHLVTQERGLLIHRCLSQLPPAHRQIIDLYYLREKSVSEVADLVGIPASTVKTRMFYARNSMAKLLEQAGITSARV